MVILILKFLILASWRWAIIRRADNYMAVVLASTVEVSCALGLLATSIVAAVKIVLMAAIPSSTHVLSMVS